MAVGIWVSTEVSFRDVEGILWGEGKTIWKTLSEQGQWECFDWLRDKLTLENETGDIDPAIVEWFNTERDADEKG